MLEASMGHQSTVFLMKHLLALRFLALLTVCLAGVEATAGTPAAAPLGANEARVTGHKATLLNAVNILVAPADKLPDAEWKNELIIPVGPNRLAIGYRSVMPGGAIGGASEFLNRVEIAFDAEAGHEYHAEMWGKSIFNMGYKITDKATGKVVGQAKVKDQKKAAKDQAKPAS